MNHGHIVVVLIVLMVSEGISAAAAEVIRCQKIDEHEPLRLQYPLHFFQGHGYIFFGHMKDGFIGVNGAEAVLFIGKSLHIAGLDMQLHLMSVGKTKGFLNLGFIDVDAGCGIAVLIKQGKRRELSACSAVKDRSADIVFAAVLQKTIQRNLIIDSLYLNLSFLYEYSIVFRVSLVKQRSLSFCGKWRYTETDI